MLRNLEDLLHEYFLYERLLHLSPDPLLVEWRHIAELDPVLLLVDLQKGLGRLSRNEKTLV